MSLTSSSSPRDRNKYGGIWRRSINFFKGCSLCYRDAIYRRVLLFVCSMNHIPPYLFLSREDDTDVGYIGKHDFRLVLLQPMLSNPTNRSSLHMRLRNWPRGSCSASKEVTTNAVLKRKRNNLTFLVFIFALNFCSKQDVFLSQQKPPSALLSVCLLKVIDSTFV